MISNPSQLSTLENGVYSDGYNILFRWYCNVERESKEKDKYLAISMGMVLSLSNGQSEYCYLILSFFFLKYF